MEAFVPLFQAVIAFVAVLTGLGFVFNLLLLPLKKDIGKLENGQAKIENRLDRLEKKLDQLLAKN